MTSPEQHLSRDEKHVNGNENEDMPDLEEFGEEPKRPLGPLAHFPSPRHALPALLLFVLFYIATVIYNTYPEGEYLWLSGDALFNRHEYWRLLTSLAAHSDLSHLLSNALIFLIFGWMLKAYFGMIAFPIASLMVGVITNAITIALYDPGIKLIGASGMAYGMVSFWLIFYVRHDADHSVPIRIFRAIGFSLVMMFPTTFDPHVSYLAHAIGFITGMAVGILLLPVIYAHDPK